MFILAWLKSALHLPGGFTAAFAALGASAGLYLVSILRILPWQ